MFSRPHFLSLVLALCLPVLGAPALAQGTPSRGALIQSFVQQRVGTVPLAEATGERREFTLEIHRVQTEISPGVSVEQWAFGLPGQPATVPGPELRVQVGDLVRIRVVNTHDQPHALHAHGITSLAQEMDGVPHTSTQILPGGSYTYEFVATQAGTHAYHCHFQTNVHLDMGMYGALIVEPRAGEGRPWTAEHTLILDEWDSRQNPADLKHDVQPDLFLVNGRTYPLIPDVPVPEGELHLLRVIHMGAQPHSLHLHGHSFLVLAKDGHDLPAPFEADTLPVLPGERYDLLVKGRDGAFPFHDHTTPQNVNGGVYPGGMHFMVTGGPARRADGTLAPPAAAHDHHAPTIPPPGAQTPAPPASPQPLPTGRPAHDHAAPAPAPTGASVIRIANFEYGPAELQIRAGTAVTWTNADPVIHHLVLTSGGQDRIHELPPGASFTFTFDQPGEFRYRCQPHPFMQGVVRVS
ncbi:multicopper oxidase family protein [Deinococcus koreensis]|uniref:Copper oxidase n=1 Tax=Deinococcus koreensis TaxID=2054903 RepID=A0A2K3USE9_9DEIO|nr:multicopper oxidase domain-containing protein [Deinococcus koreensis]PNY79466.1 copper oxidase [Deinococcus koreensis]